MSEEEYMKEQEWIHNKYPKTDFEKRHEKLIEEKENLNWFKNQRNLSE